MPPTQPAEQRGVVRRTSGRIRWRRACCQGWGHGTGGGACGRLLLRRAAESGAAATAWAGWSGRVQLAELFMACRSFSLAAAMEEALHAAARVSGVSHAGSAGFAGDTNAVDTW